MIDKVRIIKRGLKYILIWIYLIIILKYIPSEKLEIEKIFIIATTINIIFSLIELYYY